MGNLRVSNWPQTEPFFSQSNGAGQREDADHSGATAEGPPLFSGMLPEEYAKITAIARVKEFTRGDMLYIEGDSVQKVLLLTSGVAKITQLGTNGGEVILRFGVPGDVLGAMGLFSACRNCPAARHATTAQAFRTCRALVWDATAFKALLDRFPVLHQNMVQILGGDLLELEERFREVATERVGARVARQLVRLLDKIGRPLRDCGAVDIDLSREDLAQMTGTTLFTVSRLFSAWEVRGLVRPRREAVTVCDVQSLRTMSEES